MIIDLSKVVFENDIFYTVLPDGNYLVLNTVDEAFLAEGETTECKVRAINIEIRDTEGVSTPCPCVIGLGNDYMIIKTDYKQYEGEVLTPDNREYCTIEIYE